jgi:hypothetical protein
MKLKLAATALAICLVAAAAAVGAERVKSKTSLNLGPQQGQFTGAVRSDDPICVAGRKIKVKRIEPGRDETVGKDFSDINGLWSEKTDESSGSWYAKLKRAKRQGVLCTGDKSPTRAAG